MARYKFEQIAINSTEKKKPVEEDRFTYVGLEHLDPGSLKVTRFGSETAPVGEKLVMHKGDVLFGKRRAYQKKVAIAPFDGIFSAHGMVLRPKEDIVDKNFFPLFISSDYFLDEAIRISVGSLSPTINWRDLKELEFELPDLEEQRKLAEVLWAINDAMEAYKKLISATDELVKSRFAELFGDPTSNPMGWDMQNLSDIADYFIGLTYHPSDVAETGTIVLRSGNIQNASLCFDDIVRVKAEVREQLIVRKNDILMCSRNGSTALVGKVAMIPELPEKMTFGAFMTIIRSRYYDYLFTYFRLNAFRTQIATSRTATINQITKAMLDKVEIPIPPIELQEQFSAFVHQTNKSKFELEQTLSELTATYKRILSENLS